MSGVALEPEPDRRGLGIVGVCFQHFFVMFPREIGLAQLQRVEVAQKEVGASLVGVLGQHLFQFIGRVLKEFLFLQRPRVGVARSRTPG